jgi:signal transduction histidine kinase/CheY-like chemotaxis protein
VKAAQVEEPGPAPASLFFRQHPSVLPFLLVLPLVGLLIAWIDSLERTQIEKSYQQQLTSAESQIARQTTTLVSEIQRSSLSLDRELLLSGALAMERPFSRENVEALFRDFIQDQPLILQIRWLDQSGMEHARIDRREQQNGVVYFPSAEVLQDKSGRDYVKHASRLAPGDFYNSYVELNREFGEIALPHRAVVRTATKTYPKLGEMAGILVINFDISRYIRTLVQIAAATGVGIDVLDARDGKVYLSTTYPALAFSHELGGPVAPLWQQFAERQAEHRAFVASNKPQQRTTTRVLLRGPTVGPDLYTGRENIARQVWSRGDIMRFSDGGVLMDLTIPPGRIVNDNRARRIFSLGAFFVTTGVISLFAFMAFRMERRNIESLDAARNLAAAKSQFLANMSHELRTPLAGVTGMLELIEEHSESSANRQRIQFVKKSTRSLRQIIDDILDISRMQGSRLELKPTTFNPCETVARVVQLFAAAAEEKGIELTASPSDWTRQVAVSGDELRIEQVLSNLVSNAIKFTERGTVNVGLSINPSDNDKVMLRFTVSDTGIGLTPELIENLGDVFHQADSSNTREFGGTGLGLSICNNLLDMMDSELEIASTLGVGTTVSFEIELNRSKLQHLQEDDSGLEQSETLLSKSRESMEETLRYMVQSHGPPKTLVVEDSVSMQFLIKAIFENLGIPVTIAENGKEAVERTCEQTFDIVFMDLQMPVMGGVEATRQIRTRLSGDILPIVILTATLQDKEIQEAFLAGANDHLGKPIDMEELLTALLRFWQPSAPGGA